MSFYDGFRAEVMKGKYPFIQSRMPGAIYCHKDSAETWTCGLSWRFYCWWAFVGAVIGPGLFFILIVPVLRLSVKPHPIVVVGALRFTRSAPILHMPKVAAIVLSGIMVIGWALFISNLMWRAKITINLCVPSIELRTRFLIGHCESILVMYIDEFSVVKRLIRASRASNADIVPIFTVQMRLRSGNVVKLIRTVDEGIANEVARVCGQLLRNAG